MRERPILASKNGGGPPCILLAYSAWTCCAVRRPSWMVCMALHRSTLAKARGNTCRLVATHECGHAGAADARTPLSVLRQRNMCSCAFPAAAPQGAGLAFHPPTSAQALMAASTASALALHRLAYPQARPGLCWCIVGGAQQNRGWQQRSRAHGAARACARWGHWALRPPQRGTLLSPL